MVKHGRWVIKLCHHCWEPEQYWPVLVPIDYITITVQPFKRSSISLQNYRDDASNHLKNPMAYLFKLRLSSQTTHHGQAEMDVGHD